MVTKGWTRQLNFDMEVHCNNSMHWVQNNSSFNLFKHADILIQSVSLLYFRSQNYAVRSIHIPWLAQYHRHTATILLAGLWRNRFWKFGKSKHLFFTPRHVDQFCTHTIFYPVMACVISRRNVAGLEVNTYVPTLPRLRISTVTWWWRHMSSDFIINVVSILNSKQEQLGTAVLYTACTAGFMCEKCLRGE